MRRNASGGTAQRSIQYIPAVRPSPSPTKSGCVAGSIVQTLPGLVGVPRWSTDVCQNRRCQPLIYAVCLLSTIPSSHGGFHTKLPYPNTQSTPAKSAFSSTRAVAQQPAGTAIAAARRLVALRCTRLLLLYTARGRYMHGAHGSFRYSMQRREAGACTEHTTGSSTEREK